MRRLLVLLFALLLGACGFHLRGQAGMPFASLYLNAPAASAPLVADLRRNLEANGVHLTDKAEQAEVILTLSAESTQKQILSLGGTGRVSEYQLYYRLQARVHDNRQQEWLPLDRMEIRRDYTYDDTQILAKEQEERMLYDSMRSDMVQQILRRLSRAKPQPLQ